MISTWIVVILVEMIGILNAIGVEVGNTIMTALTWDTEMLVVLIVLSV